MADGKSTLNSKEKPQHTQYRENSRVFTLALTGEIEWELTSILIRKQLD